MAPRNALRHERSYSGYCLGLCFLFVGLDATAQTWVSENVLPDATFGEQLGVTAVNDGLITFFSTDYSGATHTLRKFSSTSGSSWSTTIISPSTQTGCNMSAYKQLSSFQKHGDASGNAQVVWVGFPSSGNSTTLMHAWNVGSNVYHCETIDGVGGIAGGATSAPVYDQAVVLYNGAPLIFYLTTPSNSTSLKYAIPSGGGWFAGTISSSWSLPSSITGHQVAATVYNGVPHVFFQAHSTGVGTGSLIHSYLSGTNWVTEALDGSISQMVGHTNDDVGLDIAVMNSTDPANPNSPFYLIVSYRGLNGSCAGGRYLKSAHFDGTTWTYDLHPRCEGAPNGSSLSALAGGSLGPQLFEESGAGSGAERAYSWGPAGFGEGNLLESQTNGAGNSALMWSAAALRSNGVYDVFFRVQQSGLTLGDGLYWSHSP
jgi:hypothetical protein